MNYAHSVGTYVSRDVSMCNFAYIMVGMDIE